MAFFLLVAFANLNAQSKLLVAAFEEKHEKIEYRKSFSGFMLRIYKSIFSSQDIPNTCAFHPSCSVYGAESIHKKGFILGMLATFDRLERCNGRQSEYWYKYNPNRNKYLDEVE